MCDMGDGEAHSRVKSESALASLGVVAHCRRQSVTPPAVPRPGRPSAEPARAVRSTHHRPRRARARTSSCWLTSGRRRLRFDCGTLPARSGHRLQTTDGWAHSPPTRECAQRVLSCGYGPIELWSCKTSGLVHRDWRRVARSDLAAHVCRVPSAHAAVTAVAVSAMIAVLGHMPCRPQNGLQRLAYIFFRIVSLVEMEVAAPGP